MKTSPLECKIPKHDANYPYRNACLSIQLLLLLQSAGGGLDQKFNNKKIRLFFTSVLKDLKMNNMHKMIQGGDRGTRRDVGSPAQNIQSRFCGLLKDKEGKKGKMAQSSSRN